jgi:hypothetical protein
LHIPPQEARVFVTKERCPYLITLEMFLPQEVALSPEENARDSEINNLIETPKKKGIFKMPTISIIRNTDFKSDIKSDFVTKAMIESVATKRVSDILTVAKLKKGRMLSEQSKNAI